MHGVGGPLPVNFMDQQWRLQRQILGRMRALGIVPVLPAFQGNVPPLMAKIFPSANITVQGAHWGGGEAAWLDATDPLFQTIGDRFMAQVCVCGCGGVCARARACMCVNLAEDTHTHTLTHPPTHKRAHIPTHTHVRT